MKAARRQSTKTRRKGPTAAAFHGAVDTQDGSNLIVGIGNLRVIVLKRDDFWFARGIDIDYAAQGRTERGSKAKF